MKKCKFILTDSGGIQEEAPTFGKYVLVMRETTERPEAVDSGVAKLVGSNPQKIIDAANDLIKRKKFLHDIPNPYGNGDSSSKIVKIIKEALF